MPVMELGIDSFAAAFTPDSRAVASADRLSDLIEQIVCADQVGLDSFGTAVRARVGAAGR